MTIGIYALYWAEQDLIYIGQSQNIEARFKEHVYKLNSSTHTNYKVQNAYNQYGLPELNTIDECLLENLNSLEIYYTKEFESINKGLNIVEAGSVGYGVNSNASKYNKIKILRVFSLLYSTTLSYLKISEKAKVHISLVSDISSGKSHLWLCQKYPEKYEKISDNNAIRYKIRNLVTSYPAIKSPDGVTYNITTSLTDFCKLHSTLKHSPVSSGKGIGRVLRGDRLNYLGWTLGR